MQSHCLYARYISNITIALTLDAIIKSTWLWFQATSCVNPEATKPRTFLWARWTCLFEGRKKDFCMPSTLSQNNVMISNQQSPISMDGFSATIHQQYSYTCTHCMCISENREGPKHNEEGSSALTCMRLPCRAVWAAWLPPVPSACRCRGPHSECWAPGGSRRQTCSTAGEAGISTSARTCVAKAKDGNN